MARVDDDQRGGAPEGVVVKDAQGNPVRVTRPDPHNHVRNVFALSDGTFLLLTEHTPDSSQKACRCLIHLSTRGDSLGCRYFCSPTRNLAFAMDQTDKGELLAFGNDGPGEMDASKVFVLRMNSVGDTLALYHLQRDCHSWPNAIHSMPDGGYLLSGPSGTSGVLRLDSTGKTLWSACSSGRRDASITGAIPTKDGGVLTVGHRGDMRPRSLRPADKDSAKAGNGAGALLVKYDATGDTSWQYVRSATEGSDARYAVELDNHELLVAGQQGDVMLNRQPYLMLLSAKGDSLWGAPFGSGTVHSLIVTPQGECLLMTSFRPKDKHEANVTTTVTRFAVPQQKKRP